MFMGAHADAMRYFRALYQAAQAVSSSLEVKTVLDQLARTTVDALRIKACAIRLLDDNGETLTLYAAHGLSQRYLLKGRVLTGHSPLDQAVLRSRVVIVPNVVTDPLFQYPRQAREEGIVSVLCVPLRTQGQAFGVMRAYTAEPHDFPEIEQEFVQALADLGALALVNARRYERIAHDYHA